MPEKIAIGRKRFIKEMFRKGLEFWGLFGMGMATQWYFDVANLTTSPQELPPGWDSAFDGAVRFKVKPIPETNAQIYSLLVDPNSSLEKETIWTTIIYNPDGIPIAPIIGTVTQGRIYLITSPSPIKLDCTLRGKKTESVTIGISSEQPKSKNAPIT